MARSFCLAASLAALCAAGTSASAQTTADAESDATIQQATGVALTVPDPLTRTQAVEEIYTRLWSEDRQALDAALENANANTALVRQTGTDNAVVADQRGAGNLAVMVQEGQANTSVIEQTGTDNIYGAWVVGDGNAIDVAQRGNDNVYLLDFEGSDLTHAVVQEGDNLQLVQIGDAEVPFSVEQRGSGAELTIRHNGAAVEDIP